MTFWLIAGAMTVIVIAALLAPLLRRPPAAAARGDYDLAVYRDQLAEVERDLTRGVLTEDQAAAARLEIERRMLNAAEAASAVGAPAETDIGKAKGKGKKRRSAKARAAQQKAEAPKPVPRLLAASLALFLPAAALALYLTLGAPGVPGVPFAERQGDAENPNDLAGLADRMARRLAEQGGEPREWALLGRTYAEVGRYGEAAEAARQAIEQGVDDVEIHAFFGEMLVAANNGTVVPEARATFARVLERDPGDARALFYAGLALAQDGRLREGLDLWISLAEASPPDAPWLTMLRQRIAQAADELGIEPPQIARTAPQEAVPGSQAPGPSAADMEAAAEMTPEDRTAFIRSMVDRLAARLEQEPEDLNGWLRLAHSYSVLGEAGKAGEALDRADGLVAQLPPEAPERSAVEQARQALQSMANAPSETVANQAPSQAPGPTAADVEAAAEMAPEDRMAFIRSMVDRLATRLEKEPEDLDGWLRLARAYTVLGETGKADDALDKADGLVAQLPSEAPERSAVEQAREALRSMTN